MAQLKTTFALALCAAAAACSNAPRNELEQNVDVLYMPTSADSRLQYTTPKPSPMAEDRKINEQDCSKPVSVYEGNLRCK
jgi:hypothetical protein